MWAAEPSSRTKRYPHDFETLTMVVYPGYVPGSPPGSSCENAMYPETRTVDSASLRFTWDYCGRAEGAPLDELQQGERTLTDDEYASILEALDAVTPSSAMSCGADASVLTLDLETDAGRSSTRTTSTRVARGRFTRVARSSRVSVRSTPSSPSSERAPTGRAQAARSSVCSPSARARGATSSSRAAIRTARRSSAPRTP